MTKPRIRTILLILALLLLGGLTAFAVSLERAMHRLGEGLVPALSAVARQTARVHDWDSSLAGLPLVLGSDTLGILRGSFGIYPDSALEPDSSRMAQGGRILAGALGEDQAVFGALPKGATIHVGDKPPPSSVTGFMALFADSQATTVYVARPVLDLSRLPSPRITHEMHLDSARGHMTLTPIGNEGRPIAWLWLLSSSVAIPLYGLVSR